MTAKQLDEAKAEAFAGHVVGILNGGMLSLMMSIGHRTALFDTMAEMPPSTSEGIASKVGLNERYVREWLGAMVTGGIVEFDPSNAESFATRACGVADTCGRTRQHVHADGLRA